MPHILVEHHRLHYQEYGSGYPLLLGHSYLWDHHMWQPQIESLHKKYHVIATDLWGHGQSDVVPHAPYSVQQLAEDHIALLDALGIEKAIVMGLSVGGMWATSLALEHPNRVKALVLMGTDVGCEPEDKQTQYLHMIDVIEHMGKVPEAMVDTILSMFFAPVTLQEKPTLVAPLRHFLQTMTAEQIPSIAALGRAIFTRESQLHRLQEIQVPCHVIVGKEDYARPVHEAERLAHMIGQTSCHIIPQAGHIVSLEQSGLVNQVVEAFLESVMVEELV
jgi:pimeloyl-ACP methyl ester carboxylesterase